MSEQGTRSGWFRAVGVVLFVVASVCCGTWSSWLPWFVAPADWPTWGLRNTDPSWSVEAFEPLTVAGRPVLVIRDTYQWTGGGEDPVDVYVHRLSIVDRQRGEVLGRWHAYQRFSVVAVHPDRVWIQRRDERWPEALALPSLTWEAGLGDVLEQLEPLGQPVDEVDFPPDTDTVRLTLADGFQWDLGADLRTLTRLHHDTPTPNTRHFGYSPSSCPVEATLPSGRLALLGRSSRRPGLRVVESARDVEAPEIETPHQGFLEGVFLCDQKGVPLTRAPETVFIAHDELDGERTRRLLTRVDAHGGLVWSHGVDQWLGAPFDEATSLEIEWAEDQGDLAVIWVRGGKPGADYSRHALVAFDPMTGEVRWTARL